MSNPDEKKIHTYQDMSPAPNPLHQFIVGELHFSLRTFFQNRSCYVFVAPFDVLFSENDDYDSPEHVTQPDLSVVCSKEQISKKGCHGAPSLIIEVLSPATALKDFNEKFNLYQKYGVKEYWIVDPGNRTIHLFALQDGSYSVRELYAEQDAIQSAIFADLTIPLDKLFNM
ncbi:Uma2 family endonuclease [Paenibacillus spongiae]|uniref:Uma2 family endonuclease n=1 Tax=Paenibacillus spongiae TaxID=2909671 RepID=A0ABY5SD02_9BACL|nr:Uma2 family endonuclease [Paenibacillus spongiae]UVI31817.1 Uma2 family endonuclease [Paenibacillus spongiae]